MVNAIITSILDRVVESPRDYRLIKRLVIEMGAIILNGDPNFIRAYRIAYAEALVRIPIEHRYVIGAMDSAIDMASLAEERLRLTDDGEPAFGTACTEGE